MTIETLRLHSLEIPLVRPFRTSFGTQEVRDVVLVEAIDSDGHHGWGECVTMAWPGYNAEYTAGAVAVIERYLAPGVQTTLGVSNVSFGLNPAARQVMECVDDAGRHDLPPHVGEGWTRSESVRWGTGEHRCVLADRRTADVVERDHPVHRVVVLPYPIDRRCDHR